MTKPLRIHTHPSTEKYLGIPEHHCIVDREVFDKFVEMYKLHKDLFEKEGFNMILDRGEIV